MITAVIGAFLDAKMQRPRISVALYVVSADVDGTRISRQIGARANRAIADLLASASNPLTIDPGLITSVLYGAMIGTSRILLESPSPARIFPDMRAELILLARAYLTAHATPMPAADSPRRKAPLPPSTPEPLDLANPHEAVPIFHALPGGGRGQESSLSQSAPAMTILR